MKYLKKFDTHSEYETYINGSDKILPNVSYCVDNDEVHINPYIPPPIVEAVFNIQSTSSPTAIMYFQSLSNNYFTKLEIDDVEITPIVSSYTFSTLGEHTIKYTLADETTIGASAFSGCTAMTSVVIPNSVTSIGNYAFEACKGLTSVEIPNSVTSIGISAFEACKGLTSVVIPNSVTSIGGQAFGYCSGLTSVVISNSVTSIEGFTFRGCSSLTSVTIPNSVSSIGSYAFNGCSSLAKAEFSSIEHYLNGISFSDGFASDSNPLYIAHHLYVGGSEVTNLVVPNSVTSIGESAFYRCSGLTSIEIPNSVTSIGNVAFQGCSSLASIEIPNSVTSIGYRAFSGCSNLTSITCYPITPPTLSNANAFTNTNNCPIYVPSASVSAYKAAANWSTHAARIQAIPS